MLAILFGIGIPVSLVILMHFLNPYIITIEDLKKYSHIPLLGIVGHSRRESSLIVKNYPKSLMAESFRKLRANLKYMSNGQLQSNTILITSSVSGEGKTFTSTNLGYIYALSGKKTLILGADMRKPASFLDQQTALLVKHRHGSVIEADNSSTAFRSHHRVHLSHQEPGLFNGMLLSGFIDDVHITVGLQDLAAELFRKGIPRERNEGSNNKIENLFCN